MSLSTKYQQCYDLLANIKKYFTNIKIKISLYQDNSILQVAIDMKEVIYVIYIV